MATKKIDPRVYPKGTLQRATADAAARLAAGEYVSPHDLGGSRMVAPAAPEASRPAAVLAPVE